MLVNDFFCGAGGFGLGFKQAGWIIAGAWDFNKYAVDTYRRNVGDHVQLADISELKGAFLPFANLWTFGFPCQDISNAGQKAGLIEGKRSSMFFEIMRLLGEVKNKPEMILAENVKELKKWLPVLKDEYAKAGYVMYVKMFNSKYWGVPQNRERYFVMGVRQDIDTGFFKWPKQDESFIPKLASVLEENVDEKYYLKDERAAKVIALAMEKSQDVKVGVHYSNNFATFTDVAGTCIARGPSRGCGNFTPVTGVVEPHLKVFGSLDHYGNDQMNRVYDIEGIAPTLKTMSGGGRGVNILEVKTVGNAAEENSDPTLQSLRGSNGTTEIQQRGVNESATLQQASVLQSGVYEEGIRGTEARSVGMVAVTQKGEVIQAGSVMRDMSESEEVGYTPQGRELEQQRSQQSTEGVSKLSHEIAQESKIRFRVRRLTPKEYQRLQGFPDDFTFTCSDTRIYEQMGNAVTVTKAKAIAHAAAQHLSLIIAKSEVAPV